MQINNLDNNELALLWLHSFSLGVKKREGVLSLFSSPSEMLEKFEGKKDLLLSLLGDKQYAKMTKSSPKAEAKRLLELCEKTKLKITTRVSGTYPNALREIPDSPLVLFVLGDLSLLNSDKCIAVVGTRRPTSYGKEVTHTFSAEFAKNGAVVVSGLAYGVDSISHTATLEENGKTIAVMAGGLDSIYPEAHTTLAKQIVKCGGALVSEYFPGAKPTQYTFPERNRIISGLSKGVLVVEAGENSGSLHTVSHALEQGKDLFVVPANINSVASKGSNRILVEMPDSLVTEPSQVLKRIGINPIEAQNKELNLSPDEQKIYDAVLREAVHFDDLCKITKISPSTLGSLLTIMEMNGIIRRLPNNYVEVVL